MPATLLNCFQEANNEVQSDDCLHQIDDRKEVLLSCSDFNFPKTFSMDERAQLVWVALGRKGWRDSEQFVNQAIGLVMSSRSSEIFSSILGNFINMYLLGQQSVLKAAKEACE
jgi:hypothetical protein